MSELRRCHTCAKYLVVEVPLKHPLWPRHLLCSSCHARLVPCECCERLTTPAQGDEVLANLCKECGVLTPVLNDEDLRYCAIQALMYLAQYIGVTFEPRHLQLQKKRRSTLTRKERVSVRYMLYTCPSLPRPTKSVSFALPESPTSPAPHTPSPLAALQQKVLQWPSTLGRRLPTTQPLVPSIHQPASTRTWPSTPGKTIPSPNVAPCHSVASYRAPVVMQRSESYDASPLNGSFWQERPTRPSTSPDIQLSSYGPTPGQSMVYLQPSVESPPLGPGFFSTWICGRDSHRKEVHQALETYAEAVLHSLRVRYMTRMRRDGGLHAFGLCETVRGSHSIGRTARVQGIEIRRGLPWVKTLATMCHEMIHAWIFLSRFCLPNGVHENAIKKLSTAKMVSAEEGICNAVARDFLKCTYSMLKIRELTQTEAAKVTRFLRKKVESPSEVHYQGLRAAEGAINKLGWLAAIDHVRYMGILEHV